MPTLEELDAQIADLEGQIATSQQGGAGQGPDYSSFFQSPGYDFRFNEGQRAIERSGAARGGLMSGGMGRELARYGQGFASGEFNQYANRLSALAGIGQTATGQAGQIGSAAAGQVGASAANIGQSIMSGGQAQAAGIVGSNNAWQQGISGAGNAIGGALQQWGGGGGTWGSPTASTSGYNWTNTAPGWGVF